MSLLSLSAEVYFGHWGSDQAKVFQMLPSHLKIQSVEQTEEYPRDLDTETWTLTQMATHRTHRQPCPLLPVGQQKQKATSAAHSTLSIQKHVHIYRVSQHQHGTPACLALTVWPSLDITFHIHICLSISGVYNFPS